MLAREIGLSRYERIVGFDAPPATAIGSGRRSSGAPVRMAWEGVYAARDRFGILDKVDGRQMFEPLFEYADGLDSGKPYDAAAAGELIRRTFASFVR